MDAKTITEELKKVLLEGSHITQVSYDAWFNNLFPITIENDRVLIVETHSEVPDVAIDLLNTRYKEDIRQCFEELGLDLTLKVYKPGQYTQEAAEKLEKQLEVDSLAKKAGLNPRYTFDNFIRGQNNSLAYASALAVAEMPGSTYNPLYIWGSPGLGKTHLMQSIAHWIISNDHSKKVIYVPSETFTNEMIYAISSNSTPKFRDKYRNIDVLLIDDIQFLGGKEGTQLEFYHTFNELYEHGKQIVIAGDRPPEEIQLLEERIRSRFKSGMVADIKAPDYETRVAILQKKAMINNIDIDINVLSYIANNVSSNIRELEGALTRVSAFSKLYPDHPIDIDLAQNALKDYITDMSAQIITVPHIIDIICERYNLKVEDLRSKKKPKEIAYPRQIAMYLSRKMTEEPLSSIGSYFGGRDHSTVIHACDKIASDLKGPSGDELRRSLEDLERRIEGE